MSENPETVVEEFDYELPDEVVIEIDETLEDTADAPAAAPAVVAVPMDRPVQTVGRRKEAIVRIRLLPGTGEFTLNGRPLDSYFPNKVHQQLIKEPLVTVEKAEIYDVIARLHGGGVTGQAGALRLAIARALIEVDETDRPALKKARKAPQYSKR